MILALLFHITALSATGYGLFYDFTNIKFPETEFQWHHPFGNKFKFICIQNLFIQILYYVIAISTDIGGFNENSSIQIFKDTYFSGLAFPLSLFITINFWVLYCTKRHQVLPQPIDVVIPKWHLHVLHTMTTVFMLMETLICFHKYPEFCTGLVTILTYSLSYISWLCAIRQYAGFWVYPVLNNKNFKQLFSFFASVLLQCVIIYMLGEIIHNLVWSSRLKAVDDCRKCGI